MSEASIVVLFLPLCSEVDANLLFASFAAVSDPRRTLRRVRGFAIAQVRWGKVDGRIYFRCLSSRRHLSRIDVWRAEKGERRSRGINLYRIGRERRCIH